MARTEGVGEARMTMESEEERVREWNCDKIVNCDAKMNACNMCKVKSTLQLDFVAEMRLQFHTEHIYNILLVGAI